MKKTIVSVLVVVALVASALMLVSCGSTSDAQRIQGTWKATENSQSSTVIITSTQIRAVGGTFDYKLGTSGKITLTYQGQTQDMTYAFSKDGKTLTLTQTIPSDTTSTAQPQTSKLVLTRISSDTSGEPTATAS